MIRPRMPTPEDALTDPADRAQVWDWITGVLASLEPSRCLDVAEAALLRVQQGLDTTVESCDACGMVRRLNRGEYQGGKLLGGAITRIKQTRTWLAEEDA